MQKKVAIMGTGPAALMAADVVSAAGIPVTIFEKRGSAGRKLLIAGSSGLNISSSYPLKELISHLKGAPHEYWHKLFSSFSVQDWLTFVEVLGFPVFEGSGHKYFIQDMKASGLLKKWIERLLERGVDFQFNREISDFTKNKNGSFAVSFLNSQGCSSEFMALCFCLGGGSYEETEKPLRWPTMFIKKDIKFYPFTPSNVGYQVNWNQSFLKEAEGKALKNIILSSKKGSKRGDIVITKYGIEGPPVYFVAEIGEMTLDLKPDMSVERILALCRGVKENLSPLRRVKKKVGLSEAALALLFHHAPQGTLEKIEALVQVIKKFPVTAVGTQPLDEAISSAGGIDLGELDENMMLKKMSGVFAAGEMLNWDAPTGGFLIQTCVSQGFTAGTSIVKFIHAL